MRWALAGVGYALLYSAIVLALGSHATARLWAGNAGLLIPPLVTIGVILGRRRDWAGRQLVFWVAIAAGAGLWFVGQVAWAGHELFQNKQLPWLDWDIVPQLCGSMMPLIAVVAM